MEHGTRRGKMSEARKCHVTIDVTEGEKLGRRSFCFIETEKGEIRAREENVRDGDPHLTTWLLANDNYNVFFRDLIAGGRTGKPISLVNLTLIHDRRYRIERADRGIGAEGPNVRLSISFDQEENLFLKGTIVSWKKVD